LPVFTGAPESLDSGRSGDPNLSPLHYHVTEEPEFLVGGVEVGQIRQAGAQRDAEHASDGLGIGDSGAADQGGLVLSRRESIGWRYASTRGPMQTWKIHSRNRCRRLARPGGFEPPTHSLEGSRFILYFNSLVAVGVTPAKPWASYVKSKLVTVFIDATVADFRHSCFWPRPMLHLRARTFAPLTCWSADCCMSTNRSPAPMQHSARIPPVAVRQAPTKNARPGIPVASSRMFLYRPSLGNGRGSHAKDITLCYNSACT
jgi:hypothetical protein